MKLILVCGPWGSGTTAVTQLLQAMGGYVPEPHYPTFDPRTPNSYETLALMRLFERYVDRSSISVCREGIGDALATLREELAAEPMPGPLVMKAPLAAGALPEVCAAFDTKVVFVVRPFEAIHATRLRRGWADGSVESAELVYERMTEFIAAQTAPYTILYYDELRADGPAVAERLAGFAGLSFTPEALEVVRTG